jgi:hypothetical protein
MQRVYWTKVHWTKVQACKFAVCSGNLTGLVITLAGVALPVALVSETFVAAMCRNDARDRVAAFGG